MSHLLSRNPVYGLPRFVCYFVFIAVKMTSYKGFAFPFRNVRTRVHLLVATAIYSPVIFDRRFASRLPDILTT